MRFLVLFVFLFSTQAFGQSEDTAGKWRPTHSERFGGWDSVCDARGEGPTLEERCYLRYVDVYASRPKFGALFAFVEPGPEISIGLEFGTAFGPGTIRVSGGLPWTLPPTSCRGDTACKLTGADADAALLSMEKSTEIMFNFTDSNDRPQTRSWSLSGFADAMADFRRVSASRGLGPES
ncbi:MAG: hypothetical protein AAFR35_04440 [Pseudomonadota bacterium]